MIETLFIIFFICFFIIYKLLHNNEIIYIESFDNNSYLVRNLPDKKQAAYNLAELRFKLLTFIDNLCLDIENNIKTDKNSLENYKYIKTIQKRLPNSIIKESSSNSEYTSYSINKGEELVFCLRCKKTHNLHTINLLMYVAVHEMAHTACPETGHTPLFNKIFRFLLEQAILLDLYKYEDYSAHPVEYCGMNLYTNVLD